MNIVLIFNGLGNQMSQYAFYLAKKKQTPAVQCLFYTSDASHNGYELERLFGITLPNFSGNAFFQRLFRFLSGRCILIRVLKKMLALLRIVRIYRENIQSYDYEPSMLADGKALINFYWGGWHSYKYFENLKEDIFKLYRFSENLLSKKTLDILPQAKAKNSVSIHIRRGDYTKKENYLWGGVATIDYYKKVFACLGDLTVYKFFVFSDDIDWVQENLSLPKENAIFVNWNIAENSWQDLYIMSQCQININPNSTFSWWASYLNMRDDKNVYVPDHFVITQKSKDFYPSAWKQIEIIPKGK